MLLAKPGPEIPYPIPIKSNQPIASGAPSVSESIICSERSSLPHCGYCPALLPMSLQSVSLCCKCRYDFFAGATFSCRRIKSWEPATKTNIATGETSPTSLLFLGYLSNFGFHDKITFINSFFSHLKVLCFLL